MKKKTISDAITNISAEYIEKAADYTAVKKVRKPVWVKWAAMAACFAVVAVLGVGVFQSGLFGSKTDIATLENGTKIVYHKSKIAASSIDIGVNVTTRQLTEEEIAILFPNLPVTAHAVFGDKELIGFEGNIGNTKMVISTTDIKLLDTEIIGIEETSIVNGTSVIAGYFETAPNSSGEQNAIYYATFKLGDSTVYVENAGNKSESENVKNDLSIIIQELINNGVLDLSAINGYYSAD